MSKNMVTFDVVEYEKLTTGKIKEYRSLHLKKYRDKTSSFIVEGLKGIRDTLAGFELISLICSKEWLNKNPEYQKFSDKILIDPEKKGLKQISSLTTPTEVIGVFRIPDNEETIKKVKDDRIYLLLDGIQDPGNLGTIIRTCDWFGVYEIFASKTTVDIYNPKVVQSTMGSLSRVKVRYTDLKQLIENNKEIPVIGTMLSGKPMQECEITTPAFLLMGN